LLLHLYTGGRHTFRGKRWLRRRWKIEVVESRIIVLFLGTTEMDHSPMPLATDGEASVPGPRLRRRGPRSLAALSKRRRWAIDRARNFPTLAPVAPLNVLPSLGIMHVNIQGLFSSLPELNAYIKLLAVARTQARLTRLRHSPKNWAH
jgi:hypothetical protein